MFQRQEISQKTEPPGSFLSRKRRAAGPRAPQPHRAESMGMTCFFRDMTLGRNTTSSASSTLKAWRMLSLSPTNSSWVPYSSTSVIIRITMSKPCFFCRELMSCKNSPLRWSSWSESMQVTWLTAKLWPAMWNSL